MSKPKLIPHLAPCYFPVKLFYLFLCMCNNLCEYVHVDMYVMCTYG